MKQNFLVCCLLLISLFAEAGGFQINTQSQKAAGMGGSVTGLALDASVNFYNPAGLSFLDSNYLNTGVSFVIPKTVFLGNYGSSEEMDSRIYTPFYVYASYKLKGKFTAGLSVNTPFGLGTKWEDGWSGRFVTQQVNLSTLFIQPTIAYKISEHLSAGAGPVFMMGNAKLRRALPYNDGVHGDASVELKGNGNSFGFNAGLFANYEKVSIGLNYRSGATLDVEGGDATFSNIPSSLITNNTFPSSASFNTSIKLPSVTSLGIGYRPTDKLIFNVDFNFTKWSVYDSLNFEFPDDPSLDSKNPRKYKDVMAARISVQYDWKPKLTIRGGLGYDQSPVVDGYISPELPDASKLILSAGLTYRLKSHFCIEGTFTYENIKERKESSNAVYNFNGVYSSNIYIIGIGVQYAF